jgi:hypothetical protein
MGTFVLRRRGEIPWVWNWSSFFITENISALNLLISIPFLLTASFFLWYVYSRMSEAGNLGKERGIRFVQKGILFGNQILNIR